MPGNNNRVSQIQDSSIFDPKKSAVKTPSITQIDSTPNERSKIVMRRFAQTCLAKGIDALVQEFNDLKVSCPTAAQLPNQSCARNPDKNRYKDIICIEDTRVKLIWPPGNKQDYIHANWIRNMPDMDKEIICTQGPTEATLQDFWRMVWQEKASAIIMLCTVFEGGRKKCEQYWPKDKGQSMEIATLTITNCGIEIVGPHMQYTRIQMTGKGSDGSIRKHTVNHVVWDGWPDKSVPLSTLGAVRLILKIQAFSPVIVHCSAGVGRTGTIVGLECCLRILNAGNELSVYNVIKSLRSKRFLACQTDLQYLYIHRSILAYITSKNVMDQEAVKEFNAGYEALVKSRGQVTVDNK